MNEDNEHWTLIQNYRSLRQWTVNIDSKLSVIKTMNSEHWFKTIGHSWIKDFTDCCNALIAFFLNITYLFRLVCKPIAFMPYCKMLHGCLYGEWNILTVTKFAGLRLLCSFWWTWIYHLNKYESIKKPKLKITNEYKMFITQTVARWNTSSFSY